jgi:hypothetical protein
MMMMLITASGRHGVMQQRGGGDITKLNKERASIEARFAFRMTTNPKRGVQLAGQPDLDISCDVVYLTALAVSTLIPNHG